MSSFTKFAQLLGILSIIISISFLQFSFASEFLPLWDKSSYQIGEWGTVTIKDHSKNTLPGAKNEIFVILQSDSFTEGMPLKLIETENDSGIFSASIRFSSDSNDENSLLVQEKDSVYALYQGYLRSATIESKTSLAHSLIQVSTDKTNYKSGEKIIISGSILEGNANFPINLSIYDPNGKVILSDLLDLSYVLRFDTEINTENSLWSESGNYRAQVWHEAENNNAETIFTFSTSYDLEETTKSIRIFGTEINIDYDMTSGTLSLVRANEEANSLKFSIDSTSGGHFTVELPRPIIDAKTTSDADETFVVLVDGRISEYVEKETVNERTLTIPFTYRTKTLEVQGTFLNLNPPTLAEVPIESIIIPDWIRNNAEWWSKGLINDSDFLSGIQYLINQGIMRVPLSNNSTEPSLPFIPNWIKDTAGWWVADLVSDQDFISGIQYLIDHRVIRI